MNIMFVCTGNTCRSPMAAAIFNRRMQEIDRVDLHGESAGLGAMEGQPVSENAVLACKEIGLDISGHTAHRLRGADITHCDLFVVMEDVHAKVLTGAGIPSKQVYVLDGGVEDPYGKDLDTFRACRDEITEKLKGFEKYLLQEALLQA